MSSQSSRRKLSDHFSPVAVRESPVKKIPQRGNLTGLPRVVRDLVVDVHEAITLWDAQQEEGELTIGRIVGSKLEALCSLRTSGRLQDLYTPQLESECEVLRTVVEAMERAVSQMQTVRDRVKAVLELKMGDTDGGSPMFMTWPGQWFVNVLQDVSDAYCQELAAKSCILRNIVHSTTEDAVRLHALTWRYQPYLTPSVAVAVESLLQETGHRDTLA